MPREARRLRLRAPRVARRPGAGHAARRVAPARAPVGGRRPSTAGSRSSTTLLAPGDLLVFNDTKVIPARLVGTKATGGRVELLLCEPLDGRPRPAVARDGAGVEAHPGRRHGRSSTASAPRSRRSRARASTSVALDREGAALVARSSAPGASRCRRTSAARRPTRDRERYQTVWARAPGQRRRAHRRAPLHRGAPREARGARRRADRGHAPRRPRDVPADARRLPRRSPDARRALRGPARGRRRSRGCRARGGRVVAVGTTVVRTLESAAATGAVARGAGRDGAVHPTGARLPRRWTRSSRTSTCRARRCSCSSCAFGGAGAGPRRLPEAVRAGTLLQLRRRDAALARRIDASSVL